jgi:hypothetical protein
LPGQHLILCCRWWLTQMISQAPLDQQLLSWMFLAQTQA